MELTMREKEMFVMFGCENRKLTHERLGLLKEWWLCGIIRLLV